MVEAIPMGQPLLVDHYSYKSDKNYRDRAWGKMEKSVEAGQKADYYRSKAEAAEKNTAISSDDPEAHWQAERKIAAAPRPAKPYEKVNAYYRKTAQWKALRAFPMKRRLKLTRP